MILASKQRASFAADGKKKLNLNGRDLCFVTGLNT